MKIDEFIKTLPFTLWPVQEQTLQEIYSDDYARIILRIGSHGGSSTLARLITAFEYLNAIENYESYNILPHQKVCVSLYSATHRSATEHEEMIDDLFKFEYKNVLIKFNNSMTSNHGETNAAVVFDNLDHFRYTASKIGTYRLLHTAMNSTITLGGKTFIIGSLTTESVIDEICEQFKDDPRTYIRSFATWNINPNITEAMIKEEYKFSPEFATTFETH